MFVIGFVSGWLVVLLLMWVGMKIDDYKEKKAEEKTSIENRLSLIEYRIHDIY